MRTNFDPVDKHTKDKSISAYERITTVFFRSHHFVPLKSISQRWLKDITVCTGCYDSFDDLWSCTQASAPAVHLYLAKFGASYMYSRGSVAQKQARDKPASIIAWTNDRFQTLACDQSSSPTQIPAAVTLSLTRDLRFPMKTSIAATLYLSSSDAPPCCPEAQVLDDGHHGAPQDPRHLGTHRDEMS
ncbi:hypothetical protein FMEXI_11824 [Fusarium mexicanum]|uniref:Uncharacterized protein n=1 Tax=Fusarium mexicanum TaxID=751941 RepID=A0A8H5ICD8_9HYPO|nr:hypothetical protein FMEXI_11824 [Fusarium mexicanum]